MRVAYTHVMNFIEEKGRLRPQESTQEEHGIKSYGRLLGRFLHLAGYADKVSIGGQEHFVNSNSLTKFILNSYEEQKNLPNVTKRPTSEIVPFALFKQAVHARLEKDNRLASVIEGGLKNLEAVEEAKAQLEAIKHQLGARVETDSSIRAAVRRAEKALEEENFVTLNLDLHTLRLETDKI